MPQVQQTRAQDFTAAARGNVIISNELCKRCPQLLSDFSQPMLAIPADGMWWGSCSGCSLRSVILV